MQRRKNMRYHFVRSGGFGGLRLAAIVDSDDLPEEEAALLAEELDSANFFSLPNELEGPQGGADRFQYQITVDNGEKQHTVEAGETALPEPLQPLVQHLEQIARTRHRK
jgi:hypothetical protein